MADNGTTNPQVKPGWRTTEFWVTLGTLAVTLLVGAGFLTSSNAGMVNEALTQLIAAIANAVATIYYIATRSAAKTYQAELIAKNPDLCTVCGKELTDKNRSANVHEHKDVSDNELRAH